MKISSPILIFSLLLILLAGCSSSTPQAELTPVTVQLAWKHQAQFAGFYIADQKGYYAAEGIRVTLLEGGIGVDKMAPVLDGTAQFATAGGDELIVARAAGKPFKALATIYRVSPIVFISLAEHGITRPEQFAGHTIRVVPNLIPSLHAMTSKVGVSPDQYTEINLPSDVDVFASGEATIWGAYLDGIALTISEAGYDLNYVNPDNYGVHFYGDTLFSTDEFIASNPDLVLRFARATLKGWLYAVENPEEVGSIVAAQHPESNPDLENKRMLTMLPLINTGEDHIGWMKESTWAGMEATLLKQGILSSSLDVTQVFTMQFLEEIYP